MSAKAKALIADLEGKLMPLGHFRARPMFGGYGLYIDDRIFAIIAHDRLYLKTDAENRPAFEDAGMEPFAYMSAEGKRVSLSYWECPPAIRRVGADLRRWVEKSLAAARRANLPLGRKRSRRAG